MQALGKHSIFVMRGNTGKTTAIELLRWCFKYAQSNAERKFRHMFVQPAHLLDWNFQNKDQKCEIEIQFSVGGHDYKFKRITEGVYSPKKEGKDELGDNISKIEDVIEVDRGAEVYSGDNAHKVLTDLGITASADYFIFDGERAREYMQYASDRSKVQALIDAVDERVTPSFLTGYFQALNNLQDEIYDVLGSKATSKGLSRNFGRLRELEQKITSAKKDQLGFKDEIGSRERTAKQLGGEISKLTEQIIEAKSKSLTDLTTISNEIKGTKEQINRERSLLYKNFLKLIPHVSDEEVINKIKTEIRERGKLPEPYRKELIELCLEANPPSCHICGRKLDKQSEERIKFLEKQVAPHDVQLFLSSPIYYETKPFDLNERCNEIDKSLKKIEIKEKELGRVKLSSAEQNLINDRDARQQVHDQLLREIGDYRGNLIACEEAIREDEAEKVKILEKGKLLGEYKSVLDEIDDAKKILEKTKETIKKETINVISEAIGKSVKSILGAPFSARLTADSLYLGEAGVYHPEVGGMSGRLILSYCFAESMTRVNPMIIDTPVGNIDDTQRTKLAEHLKANHKQVILLCLPTELGYFAPAFSSKPTEITNDGENVTWVKS